MITQIGTHAPESGSVIRLSPGGAWGADLQQRIREARKEVVLAVCEPILPQRRYPAGEALVRDMLTTGKRVQLLFSSDYAGSRDQGAVSAFPYGDRIRVTYTSFQNTLIIDHRAAIVWSAVNGRPEAFVFNQNSLVDAIHRTVTGAWSSALSLRDHAELQRRDFDATTVSVIRYLGFGVTDEVAARELSVSLRTYRRYVANVMERLGVATRYQLGVRVAELGLSQ
ncbi:hypothetical protein [Nocardia tengchongensis]|uniref:hypothetical protein n=1 Tax=Nocardia tengchongensis TaxID=2055889 RepID=UPI00368A4CEE